MHFTLRCYSLLEEGGTMFTFEGTGKKCTPKSVLRVHNPQFYWKVCTSKFCKNKDQRSVEVTRHYVETGTSH
jgi:hypothetical protein